MQSAHACVCTHRNPTAGPAADILLQPLMAPSLILAWTAQLLLFEFPSPPPQPFTSHHCQRTDLGHRWSFSASRAAPGPRTNGLVPVKAFGPSPPSTQLHPHQEQASMGPPSCVTSNPTRPRLSLRCPLWPMGDISHGGCQRLTLPACPGIFHPESASWRAGPCSRTSALTGPNPLSVYGHPGDTYLRGNSSRGPAVSDPMTLGKSLHHSESLSVFSYTIGGFVVRTESQHIPRD